MADTTLVRPPELASFDTESEAMTLPPRKVLADKRRDIRIEWVLIVLLILAGAVLHGTNMFNYPSITFLDDEGIYMAQSWSVINQYKLTPYTYFYDHSPVGWLMIALFQTITGGTRSFVSAIDGGRLFMFVVHLAMIPLLFQITRKLSGSMVAATVACLLFSISPLALFYQRMILLDNIMLFWVLLSINLLLDDVGRLSRVLMSGVAFGLGVLCKETAIFLVPVMLYLVWMQRRPHQGRYTFALWLAPMIGVVSWYPLYALVKGELFPAGKVLQFLMFRFDTGDNHVSLLEALSWQSTRGGGGMFNLDNLFWQLVRYDWFPRDALLVAVGAFAVLFNLLRGIFDRKALVAALFAFLPLLYLGRGGVVFNYYILFAIPFVCLNIGLLVAPVFKWMPRKISVGVACILLAILVTTYTQTSRFASLYNENPSQAGRDAVAWMKKNIDHNSLIITRDDLWTDLRDPGFGGPGFPNIHSHWKVALDPAITNGVFKNDWQTVDYIIMSPGLEGAFRGTNDQLALDALAHAKPIKKWTSQGAEVELWQVIKVGGDT